MVTDRVPDRQPQAIDRLKIDDSSFQWTKQWYPVAVIESLDTTRPHSVLLLGKSLVLWRDDSETWRCFEDACPHRLAPLSEGRVEKDGTLLCAYHAWRFDGEGTCARIPQAKDAKAEAKHRNHSKACAIVYPTQVRQGLVWVWAESGEEALEESKMRSPALVAALEGDRSKAVANGWTFRDLPYGWDFFMENVADPAHVPVAHHGLVGNRYTDPKFYDMIRLREMTTQNGFSYGITPTAATVENAQHDFHPPALMHISTAFKSGGALNLVLYATPTKPGWCRHFGQQVLLKDNEGKVPKGLAFFSLPQPSWLLHVLASLFLHQDMVFLHFQEKIVANRQNRWLEAVYTPNPQDKMTIAFRQWFETRAGGNIPWFSSATLPPAEPKKAELFDVWHTHTKNCVVCQRALKRVNWAIRLAYAAAVLVFGLALMVDARTVALHAAAMTNAGWLVPSVSVWALFLAALALAAMGYGFTRLRTLFYRYEFDHSKND